MATLTATRPQTTDSVTDPLVEQLMRIEGKAEIVDGEIQTFMPTGDYPNYAAGAIYVSLFNFAAREGGRAVSDNAGFLCDLPKRKSFSPDAAYYTGPSGGMGFFPQPPVFAVEVRSENDYGPAAERQMAAKRADYFAAGTLVVWDVDLQNEEVVAKYTATAPTEPQLFRRGAVADAAEAVPGWSLNVDELFAPSS